MLSSLLHCRMADLTVLCTSICSVSANSQPCSETKTPLHDLHSSLSGPRLSFTHNSLPGLRVAESHPELPGQAREAAFPWTPYCGQGSPHEG